MPLEGPKWKWGISIRTKDSINQGYKLRKLKVYKSYFDHSTFEKDESAEGCFQIIQTGEATMYRIGEHDDFIKCILTKKKIKPKIHSSQINDEEQWSAYTKLKASYKEWFEVSGR